MKSFKYSLRWEGNNVLVMAQDKHGSMQKLYFGPAAEAKIALYGWKTGIEAAGLDYHSDVSNFDWNQI